MAEISNYCRYPRRQTSLLSPREIPLPSPTLSEFPFPTTPHDTDNNASTATMTTPRLNSEHVLSPIYPTPRPTSLPPFSLSFSPPPPPTPTAEIPRPPPTDRNSAASLPLPSQIPFHILPKTNTTEPSSPMNNRSAVRFPSVDPISSSSSSSSSGSRDSITTLASSCHSDSDKPAPIPSTPPRPISPFRAPQPPPSHFQPFSSSSSEFNTAMRRFMSPRPPRTSSPQLDTSSSSPVYPPPEPPTILPAEPTDDMSQPSARAAYMGSRAPYAPFLSHAPPPADSWIEVETTHAEYRLHVRLPGFSREGITLATKRRRILHVVADSWENGGGHFERRISFGYDADLVQVRAEFDGVMLNIVVPRRVSPIVWHSPSRSGPIGRA